MSNPWVALLTGSDLAGFRLERCVGEGQFGLVFEVTKSSSGGVFAMKVLTPSATIDSRIDFSNEGALLRKLSSCAFVINFIESGTAQLRMSMGDGLPVDVPVDFHVIALASGSLEELVQDPVIRNKLSWTERLRLWRGAVKAIHQMHLKSVVHRDLKSSNCLLVIAGTKSELRIADLGRSRDLGQQPTHQPQAYLSGLGDFRYAPPELLWLQGGSSPADFKNADLYGLGSLLVELITGHPMTALAIASWSDARKDGITDFNAGVTRDLATLRPQYRAAIDSFSEDVPTAVRSNLLRLLSQLCDPVPSSRQPRQIRGQREKSDDGLLWLLRQSDILQRQLQTESRRTRYVKSTIGRTA